jgi:Protein of unknown function (DUF1236)
MKTTRLLSTVAAALLFTAGAASAQGMNKGNEQPQKAPSAQQNAPAEKSGQPMHSSGGMKADQGQSAKNKADTKRETTGQAPKSESEKGSTMNKSSEKNGAAMKRNEAQKNETQKNASEPSKQPSAQNKAQSSPSNQNNAQGSMSNKSSQSSTTQTQTTGQGAAGAAHLSTEQRTKITSVIKQQKVEPVHANFDVRVGVRVPESVRFHPLPREVVTIYPEWRGFDYILVGEQIIVINPRTHEIVAILEA